MFDPSVSPSLELVVLSLGNTRARLGHFRGRTLESAASYPLSDPGALIRAILDLPAPAGAPLVIASVNTAATEALLAHPGLSERGERSPDATYLFGRDLSIPIQTALSAEGARSAGQDRLLSALGAYARAQQACIVVDAGTAMTVDFVDGEGVFQGGAIAPGLNMMLRAMHEQTSALPAATFELIPDDQPFGKDTLAAMRLGVQAAARGMVRHLAERYAGAFGAYPQIVATGGDARVLFENDDLIEAIVPDLTLIGMQTACELQLGADEEED